MIKQVIETKFLGILIDHHLSWKPLISLVSKKISKSIGIIAKAHFYLSSKEENLPIFILKGSYIRFKSHQKRESKNLYQLLGGCSHYADFPVTVLVWSKFSFCAYSLLTEASNHNK